MAASRFPVDTTRSLLPPHLLTLQVFSFSILLLSSSRAASLSFSFNFSGDSPTVCPPCDSAPPLPAGKLGLCCQGDAFSNRVGLQLTSDEAYKSLTKSEGRAVYSDKVLLWDRETGRLTDFTAHFSFRINALNASNSADGLAFFLSRYPSAIPENSKGGFLGLFANTTRPDTWNNQLVAVEFDTFANVEWGESPGSHIGIDVNHIESVANVTVEIRRNTTAHAWVTYNGSTQRLSTFLAYPDDGAGPVSYDGKASNLSFLVDLSRILPDHVAVGFSAATGDSVETHTLLSWSFNSTLEKVRRKHSSLLVGGLISAGVAANFVATAYFLWRRRRRRRRKERSRAEAEALKAMELSEGKRAPKLIPYDVLLSATNNFSGERLLGKGGFGSVYKGHLKGWGLDVAIKKLSEKSTQGFKEYISEVEIISQLRHRNLVRLVGWCHHRGQLLLAYEFMPNGSLDTHLFKGKTLMGWSVRYKIAVGLACALQYLHEECDRYVLHRDVKSSNVLLDSHFNAKLGDFGLAKLSRHDQDCSTLQVTFPAGTHGYRAPEYAFTGKASKASDVYSFGVVALEIACGRKAVEPQLVVAKPAADDDDDVDGDQEHDEEEEEDEDHGVVLVEWVWQLYGRGALLEGADGRLHGEFDKREMERLMSIGLWCAHPDPRQRPSIRQAVELIWHPELPMPPLPQKMPTITYTGSSVMTTQVAIEVSRTLSSVGASASASTAEGSSSSVPTETSHFPAGGEGRNCGRME